MNRVLDGLSSLNTQYDILVMGETGVGKTTLVHRYVYGTYSEGPHDQAEQLYVKGLENEYAETLASTSSHNSSINEISILDSSPLADVYAASRKQQIKNTSTVLFAYAMDDKSSFEALEYMIDTVRTLCDGVLPPFVIVATKSDLYDNYQVYWEEGEALANRLGALGFFVVSALSDSNVEECFAPLVEIALQSKFHHECRSDENTLQGALASSPTSPNLKHKQDSTFKFQRPVQLPESTAANDRPSPPSSLPAIESFTSDFPDSEHPEISSDTTRIASPPQEERKGRLKLPQSASSISTGSPVNRVRSEPKREVAQQKEKSRCCVIV